METGAKFSSDRHYRYALWRVWDNSLPFVLFIGLNPSTADAHKDDPTIRRCKRFAKDWGYGGVYVTNLFALRATYPKDLKGHPSPVGPVNNKWLLSLAADAGVIVCAWGTNGSHHGQDKKVLDLLGKFEKQCLGLTKQGHPRHPLYVRADQRLQRYLK